MLEEDSSILMTGKSVLVNIASHGIAGGSDGHTDRDKVIAPLVKIYDSIILCCFIAIK